jgi:hypothetical protein
MISLLEIVAAVRAAGLKCDISVASQSVLLHPPWHSKGPFELSVSPSATDAEGFVVHSYANDDPLQCREFMRGILKLPPRKLDRNGRGYKPPTAANTIKHAAILAAQARAAAAASSATPAPKVPASAPAVVAPESAPRVVATYPYRDASGALLYEVQRLDPKSFRQRRPVDGGYVYSLGDVKPVLYRLPELLAFPDATTFLCEGEKDADNVAVFGFTATTISGSTTWTPELAEPLRSRDVIILVDADVPGAARAEKAALALHGVAASIRLVLLPDLPLGGDVSDYLDAGNSKAQLEEVCLSAPIWEPQAEQAAADSEEPLGEWDAGDDTAEIPPRGWLLGNIFCRRFISSVIADGGTGKSALRLAQLLSLAVGRALTSEHVFMRCRVLIVSLEDNADELRRRLRAACLHHGVEQAELKGWLFLAAPGVAGGKLMVLDPHGRPILGNLAGKLARTIAERKIDIASLDPFVKSHGIEENNNSMIDSVVQVLADMAEQFDMAIDVPHHAAKGPADPGNANRGRGASSMKDAGRLIYTLTPMSPEEGQAFGLSELDRRRLIRLDSAKVNITPPMTDAKWFRIVGVEIGNGSERYPHGDQVQTIEPWTPPDTFAGMSNLILNQILNDIEAGLPDGNRYTDAPNVIERAAWRVIEKFCAGKSEAACRQIIKLWLKSGLLIRRTYENKATRKPANGLWVDNGKRPS